MRNSGRCLETRRVRGLVWTFAAVLLVSFVCVDADAQSRSKKKYRKRNQSGPVQDRAIDEVSNIRSTGMDPSDIEPMAQQIVRDILSSPAFAAAMRAEEGDSAKPDRVVRVALRPMANYTSQRIDPEIITRRIENFLIRESAGKIQFLARTLDTSEAGISSDVQAEQQMRLSGVVDSAPGRRLASADFFMKGEIREHQTVTAAGRDRMIQFTFWLESTETLAKVWQNQYLIRRSAVKDPAYR